MENNILLDLLDSSDKTAIKKHEELLEAIKLFHESKESYYRNKYQDKLTEGIPVKNNKVMDNLILGIRESIVELLKVAEMVYEPFDIMLKNTKYVVTDVKTFLGFPGMATVGVRKVFLDHSIVDFDEEGFLLGINKDDLERYHKTIHIITHELFHRISAFREDKQTNLPLGKLSAFSEGYTDFFASLISGYSGSDSYVFSKDICGLFTFMLGLKDSLDDYLNHCGEYPKLRELFKKYDLNFENFEESFNRVLEKRYNFVNNQSNMSPEELMLKEKELLEEENELLILIKDKLLIPYLSELSDQNKKYEILEYFNSIFGDRNIKINRPRTI